jgi:predicted transcriptional regulator of viral defense system
MFFNYLFIFLLVNKYNMYVKKGKRVFLTKNVISILEYKKTRFISKKELIEIITKYTNSKNPLRLIKNLINRKKIISIKRNIYLYIPVSSIDLKPTASEYEINEKYLENTDYYVGLTNALNYYGFTNQIPNQLFVFNTRYSLNKKIINFKIKYIKISKDQMFGIVNKKYPYSNIEKTIIDSLNYFKYIDSLEKIINLISNNKKRFNEEKLIKYAKRYKSIKLLKLIGIITENQNLYDYLKKKKKLRYYTKIRNTNNNKKYRKWKIMLT